MRGRKIESSLKNEQVRTIIDDPSVMILANDGVIGLLFNCFRANQRHEPTKDHEEAVKEGQQKSPQSNMTGEDRSKGSVVVSSAKSTGNENNSRCDITSSIEKGWSRTEGRET